MIKKRWEESGMYQEAPMVLSEKRGDLELAVSNKKSPGSQIGWVL